MYKRPPIYLKVVVTNDPCNDGVLIDTTVQGFENGQPKPASELMTPYFHNCGIEISAWLNGESKRWQFLAPSEFEYRPRSVNVTQAGHMRRTLQRLNSNLQKFADKFGDPADPGQAVTWICQALGAEGMLTQDHIDGTWHVWRDAQIGRIVNDMLWALRPLTKRPAGR